LNSDKLSSRGDALLVLLVEEVEHPPPSSPEALPIASNMQSCRLLDRIRDGVACIPGKGLL
jgi:hypothetical protein